MKKYLTLFFLMFFILGIILIPDKVQAAQSVSVKIPDFLVTINGEKMDNTYNQYPLIVYKDITYFPMAYDYARFLGVKANWYERRNVLFLGVAEEKAKSFKEYKTAKPNKKVNSATIPNYSIAINVTDSDEFISNKNAKYPILNFRNITYIPLTWEFAVEEFGWDYNWDKKSGLQIKCNEPFRPVIYDGVIGATLPTTAPRGYFYGKEYYVIYPPSTPYTFNFIVRKKGSDEKTFNMREQFNADYYFNARLDTNGPGLPVHPTSDIKPSIEGNIFSIVCIKCLKNNTYTSVSLKINLDTGKVVSEEEIAPRRV